MKNIKKILFFFTVGLFVFYIYWINRSIDSSDIIGVYNCRFQKNIYSVELYKDNMFGCIFVSKDNKSYESNGKWELLYDNNKPRIVLEDIVLGDSNNVVCVHNRFNTYLKRDWLGRILIILDSDAAIYLTKSKQTSK